MKKVVFGNFASSFWKISTDRKRSMHQNRKKNRQNNESELSVNSDFAFLFFAVRI